MGNEFISPNWHVVLLHAPLGLVIVGVLIELLSFISPRGGFRAAGRWMMGIGALLAIPTATLGVYAFRDVVTAGPMAIGASWVQVAAASDWIPAQWEFISNHIWFNAFAVLLLLVAVIFWLAGSDEFRRGAYIPLLLVVLIGAGLLVVGAWHGGELVYRYGTGVDAQQTVAGAAPGAAAVAEVPDEGDIEYYIPPLQLHLLLAGLVGAFVVGAFALMIRRWQLDSAGLIPLRRGEPVTLGVGEPREEMTREERVELRSAGPYGAERVVVGEPKVYPGWFWLGAFLLGLCAALAGIWSVLGSFATQALQSGYIALWEAEHVRLLLHVIFGVSLIVGALILAGLVRFARRWRVMAGIFGAVVLLLLAGQIYLGVMMVFDGHEGPLLAFRSGAAAVEEVEQEVDEPGVIDEAPAPVAPQDEVEAPAMPGQGPTVEPEQGEVATPEQGPVIEVRPAPQGDEPAEEPGAAEETVEPGPEGQAAPESGDGEPGWIDVRGGDGRGA